MRLGTVAAVIAIAALALASFSYAAIKIGTPNDDTIIGTDSTDVIHALRGDDTVFPRGGIDVVFGGLDNDTLNSSGGADVLDGGADGDVISDANHAGDLDVLLGSNAADLIDSSDNEPFDVIDAGNGNDTCTVDDGDIVLFCENVN